MAKLWDTPDFNGVREWFVDKKREIVERAIGVGPDELERVTAYLPVFNERDEPVPVVVVTTRRPYSEARVVKNLLAGDGGRGNRLGSLVRIEDNSLFQSAFLVDERTLLLVPRTRAERGSDATAALAGHLLARRADGPLAPALAAAGSNVVSVGLDPRQVAGMIDLPPYAAALRATGATFTADYGKDGLKTRLALAYATPDDARRAGPVVREAVADLSAKMADEAKAAATRGDRGALEAAVFGWGASVLKTAKVEVDGASVVAAADGQAEGVAKVLAALPKQLAASAQNTRAVNNLKQILIGLHAAHDTFANFPSDVGPDRKSAWSWRVQLLPFIEQDQLYRQLDLQLPWDNPRNKAVLEKAEMPKVFEVPGRPAPKGHTYWRSFTLPKKAQPKAGHPWLTEGERGPTVGAITDGMSNTFAVVEAGEAVPWYAPDVLAYDGKRPLPPLGEKDGPGFLAGMGDGSVRFIRAKTDEAAIRAAVTRNGGEVVPLP